MFSLLAQAAAPVASPSATAAASAVVAEAQKPWYVEMLDTGAMKYMIDGGIFMWPILILGILALGVIIERYRSLKMLSTDSEELRREVLDLLQQDRVEEALDRCNAAQGPVAAILGAGLRKLLVLRKLGWDPGKIEEQVVKAMDDYGVHVTAALERHLPVLATVSSVAPMLGFLGTEQGMVISFQDIVDNLNKMNIVEAAAAGIMTALLTTVLGLVVGIPAFTAFNYYTSVINRFVLDVETSASELIEAVTLQAVIDRQASPAEAPVEAPVS
jgi:biopolymer transport protein ExbB